MKWYNLGYGISAVNTDELNTIYCQEFYNYVWQIASTKQHESSCIVKRNT